MELRPPQRVPPKVSVLVTTYNHARYLEEALDSLRRQTSQDFETIITDDASTDGSAEVIAAWLARTGFAAQFIRNPHNRGICANRNAALARASGIFVCSLSGDDAYAPDRIARQLAFFLTQPARVAAIYSDALVVDADGRPCGSFMAPLLAGRAPPQGDIFERVLANNFLPAPAVMVRRSAIAAVGGYDERLFYEDIDMWLRLSHRFDVAYLPGQPVRFRVLVLVRAGKASVVPILPGDSYASPQLEHDAMLPLAAATVAFVPKGAKCPVDVLDTRLVGGAPAGAKTPWNEVWTVRTCGTRLTVPVQFVPDAVGPGTTIHIESKSVKTAQ